MANVIFAERRIGGFVSGELMISPAPFTLTAGVTYRVVWDGIEHECVCSHATQSEGAPTITDLVIDTSGEDLVATEGTFAIAYGSPAMTGGDSVVGIVAYDLSSDDLLDVVNTEHTLAIYQANGSADDVVLSEQVLEFHGGEYLGALFGLAVGETYRVVFDGVEYTVAVKAATVLGYNAVASGNLALLDGSFEQADYPFAFGDLTDTGMGAFYINDTADTSSHTVAIYAVDNATEDSDGVILSEQTLDGFHYTPDLGAYICSRTGWFSLQEGATYRIFWDSEEHACVAYFYNYGGYDAIMLGNESYIKGENTEVVEPFIIYQVLDNNYCAVASTTDTEVATHRLAIYAADDVTDDETYNSNDAVILNYSQNPNLYEKIPKVWLTHPSSTDEAPVLVPFTYGEAVSKTVEPDFSGGGDMVVEIAEGELVTELKIARPADLTPENIPEGKYIAGVGPGEFKGAGDSSDDEGVANTNKPIRFYDPYGNVIYSYTRDEIQALDSLPPGPALTGVTFDAWTHTLDEIKTTQYFADVGPMYKYGSAPATVMIVETFFANESVSVCLDMWVSSYAATVYWGDGESSSLRGSSTSSARSASHSYGAVGLHTIAIVCTSGLFNIGSSADSYYYSGTGNTGIPSMTTAASYFKTTPNTQFISVLIGSYSSSYAACIGCLCASQRLRFVSVYSASNLRAGSPKRYLQCPSIKVIAGNKHQERISAYQFYGCSSLKRVWIGEDVPADAFIMCDSIEEVIYGDGAIAEPKMNIDWSMLMTSTMPPTISSTSPQWGTKPIYVPDEAVETYKAAVGWSTVADYILPASQYTGRVD